MAAQSWYPQVGPLPAADGAIPSVVYDAKHNVLLWQILLFWQPRSAHFDSGVDKPDVTLQEQPPQPPQDQPGGGHWRAQAVQRTDPEDGASQRLSSLSGPVLDACLSTHVCTRSETEQLQTAVCTAAT